MRICIRKKFLPSSTPPPSFLLLSLILGNSWINLTTSGVLLYFRLGAVKFHNMNNSHALPGSVAAQRLGGAGGMLLDAPISPHPHPRPFSAVTGGQQGKNGERARARQQERKLRWRKTQSQSLSESAKITLRQDIPQYQ